MTKIFSFLLNTNSDWNATSHYKIEINNLQIACVPVAFLGIMPKTEGLKFEIICDSVVIQKSRFFCGSRHFSVVTSVFTETAVKSSNCG